MLTEIESTFLARQRPDVVVRGIRMFPIRRSKRRARSAVSHRRSSKGVPGSWSRRSVNEPLGGCLSARAEAYALMHEDLEVRKPPPTPA